MSLDNDILMGRNFHPQAKIMDLAVVISEGGLIGLGLRSHQVHT